MLNIAAPFIYLSLTHTLNLTVVSGKLPSDFKIARVTPIYKGKGPVNDHGNYRPISVVATITKLLESAIKKQLMDFLTVNNIISNSQFAYMKNMSTQFRVDMYLSMIFYTLLMIKRLVDWFSSICKKDLTLYPMIFYYIN